MRSCFVFAAFQQVVIILCLVTKWSNQDNLYKKRRHHLYHLSIFAKFPICIKSVISSWLCARTNYAIFFVYFFCKSGMLDILLILGGLLMITFVVYLKNKWHFDKPLLIYRVRAKISWGSSHDYFCGIFEKQVTFWYTIINT